MNEKIKELYAKALSEAGEDGEAAMVEAFAKLIVRECADQVDDYFCDFYNKTAADKIKEHFGVEE